MATHGHTKGRVSVVVDYGHSVFLAGDTSYNQALMVDGAIDGVTRDVRAARETLDRIRDFTRQQPVVYLPSHDPKASERLNARDSHELTGRVGLRLSPQRRVARGS